MFWTNNTLNLKLKSGICIRPVRKVIRGFINKEDEWVEVKQDYILSDEGTIKGTSSDYLEE